MDLRSEQLSFLKAVQVASKYQATGNCLRAALQHNPTYSVAHEYRGPFRYALANELERQYDRYARIVEDAEHNEIIEKIAQNLSSTHGHILQGNRLRIGTVQKALNLYFKIIWCLEPGRPTPPHCPVDRIVLQAGGIYDNWTQLDSIETYKTWIAELRKCVARDSYPSLSEWELCRWNTMVPASEFFGVEPAPRNSHGASNEAISNGERHNLPIQDKFSGKWSGLIRGDRRTPYPGELAITSQGGHSRYVMHKGDVLIGTLAFTRDRDGDACLQETMGGKGRCGRIYLSPTDEDAIECRWHYGPNATMRRIE